METTNIWYLPSSRRANIDLSEFLYATYKITPALWLGDDIHRDFVSVNFPSCKLLEHAKLLQSDAPEIEDLSTLELLSTFFQSEIFRKWLPHILQEFNRFPTLAHTRSLDRDVFARNIFATLLDSIRSVSKIRLAVFSETPHDPVILCAYVLCKFLDIPTLFFQPSNIGPFLLPRIEIDQTLSLTKYKIPKISDDLLFEMNKCIDSSVSQILRTEPWPYMVDQRNFDASNKLIKKIRTKTKLFVTKIKNLVRKKFLRELANETLRYLLFRHFKKNLLIGAENIETFASTDLPEQFGLFPLHFEPERTSNPEAFPWLIQADAVLASRALLPDSDTLIVKEHYSQITGALLGYLGRSQRTYGYISRMPKTGFVETTSEANVLISKASIVFTLTGTVGIEAALNGKPVVYFGCPWWEGTPGTYAYQDVKVSGLSEISAASRTNVIKSLRQNAIDKMIPGTGTEDEDNRWKPFFSSYDKLLETEKTSKARIIYEMTLEI